MGPLPAEPSKTGRWYVDSAKRVKPNPASRTGHADRSTGIFSCASLLHGRPIEVQNLDESILFVVDLESMDDASLG